MKFFSLGKKYTIYEDGSVFKNGNVPFTPPISGNGYYVLCSEGKHYLLHRLIIEHFKPQTEVDKLLNRNVVDHEDRNRLNNDINNLRWVTQSENLLNTVRHDRYKNLKLNDETIAYIDILKKHVLG